jgi:hypothetical protein
VLLKVIAKLNIHGLAKLTETARGNDVGVEQGELKVATGTQYAHTLAQRQVVLVSATARWTP